MRALAKVFPEHGSYLRLLSLAYYLVLQSNSSLCDFEEFVTAPGFRTLEEKLEVLSVVS